MALATQEAHWDLDSGADSPAPHLWPGFCMSPALLPSVLVLKCLELSESGVEVEEGGVGAPRVAEMSGSSGQTLKSACQSAGEPYQVGRGQWVGVVPPGAGKRAEHFL